MDVRNDEEGKTQKKNQRTLVVINTRRAGKRVKTRNVGKNMNDTEQYEKE